MTIEFIDTPVWTRLENKYANPSSNPHTSRTQKIHSSLGSSLKILRQISYSFLCASISTSVEWRK